MTKLSVNLNKIALLRNQRNIGIPDVIESAGIVIKAGAHGITVHVELVQFILKSRFLPFSSMVVFHRCSHPKGTCRYFLELHAFRERGGDQGHFPFGRSGYVEQVGRRLPHHAHAYLGNAVAAEEVAVLFGAALYPGHIPEAHQVAVGAGRDHQGAEVHRIPERALDPPEQPMDADLQRLLGELARGASPIPLSATDLPRIKELARRMTLTAGAWFLALLACALVVLYSVKLWRRLAPSWARAAALPRVVYRAELDRISEVAIRREPGESRESFANRVGDRLPSFEVLTAAHVAHAFGGHQPDPRWLRDEAANVRRDLRNRFPLWKRFLGSMTPWSWLRSK